MKWRTFPRFSHAAFPIRCAENFLGPFTCKHTVWETVTKFCMVITLFLIPGSSRVKDALGDTIPSAPPVLHSRFNLVPAHAYFPEIFLDDIFPVLSWSTWPPAATFGFPYESLSRKSKVIHSWKISKPSQTSASDNVFQLWKCSCLSDFLICYFVLPGNPQDTSFPSVVCCFEYFSFGWLRLATALHFWAIWRGLVLHKASVKLY